MCGIGGIFGSQHPVAPERLRALSAAMRHRGPDGDGHVAWQTDQGFGEPGLPSAVQLVHRRLSILDLSEAAHQPMLSADRRSALSFNGEIYNYRNLRARLPDRSSVRSTGDTEVLRHLLEHLPLTDVVEQLNGMFAFAWAEPDQNRLALVRDRLGKKPLYYAVQPDGSLAFASELPALFAGGFADPSLHDPDAVDAYWTLGYIPAPRTIYRDVKQVPPGHLLVWENGRITQTAYWQCTLGADPRTVGTLDLWADELEALLCDSIRLRLIADVPVGLFLSGGIDSSLICALARQAGDHELHTYTIGFPGHDSDESEAAREVAEQLGLPNTLLPAHAPVALGVRRVFRQFGQPFGDLSALPTWMVCALAREHVKVVLTGDAGDELFAGYDDYLEGLRLWGPPPYRATWTPRRAWFRRLGPAAGFARWAMLLGPRHRKRLFRSSDTVSRWASDYRKTLGEDVPGAEPLAVMQNMDLHSYLADDILVKLDRMSMAVSLEARCPLLDHRIVEFAARLPFEAKMGEDGRGKRILRHLLARHLPMERFDRPKQGFTPPWKAWMQGQGVGQVEDPWCRQPLSSVLPLEHGDDRLDWTARSWQEWLAAPGGPVLRDAP